MPRVESELAFDESGVQRHRIWIHTDDKKKYRIHDRARINGEWQSAYGETATHRVFVDGQGRNYRYQFLTRECRHLDAACIVAAQLAAALIAGAVRDREAV